MYNDWFLGYIYAKQMSGNYCSSEFTYISVIPIFVVHTHPPLLFITSFIIFLLYGCARYVSMHQRTCKKRIYHFRFFFFFFAAVERESGAKDSISYSSKIGSVKRLFINWP